MKTWLRLCLVTMTVGGGFAGFATIFQALFTPAIRDSSANMCIGLVFLALYGFVVLAGLAFVRNPQQLTLLVVALALQIPELFLPSFSYQFRSGFAVVAGIGEAGLTGTIYLGSQFACYFQQAFPWEMAINLPPIILLVLLHRHLRFGAAPPLGLEQNGFPIGPAAGLGGAHEPSEAIKVDQIPY